MTTQLADFLEVFGDVNKTGIMLLILLFAGAFRIKGWIDGPGFVELCKATTISFFGTTTVVHFTSMIKDVIIDKAKTAAAALKDSKNEG